jgi:hypothetical protein
MTATQVQVVFDCADPAAQAAFWAEALHYIVPAPPPPHATWQDFLRAEGVPEESWNDANGAMEKRGEYWVRMNDPEATSSASSELAAATPGVIGGLGGIGPWLELLARLAQLRLVGALLGLVVGQGLGRVDVTERRV